MSRKEILDRVPAEERALWRLGSYAEAPDLRYLEVGQALGGALMAIFGRGRRRPPVEAVPAPVNESATEPAPEYREAA